MCIGLNLMCAKYYLISFFDLHTHTHNVSRFEVQLMFRHFKPGEKKSFKNARETCHILPNTD